MKFEIKHRFTGAVLFSLETDSLKLCVQAAVKSGADLRAADLRGADLRGADLRGADLRGADLRGADLRAAIFSYEQASPEETARLDAVREIILEQPDRLDMNLWHGNKWNPTHTPEEEQSCGTPHCLAGWLQALSPDEEIRKLEAQDAGEKLAPTASKLFFTSNEVVMDFLKNRRYAQPQERE